jgi:cytoskeletal protein CcmA (bactofilin family)
MKKHHINIKLLDKQLPARALVFALLVVLMVALVSGALISLAYLQTTQFQLQQDRQEVLRNANSGFQYLLAQDKVENKKIEAHFDLFGQNRDSVLLRRYPWGFYDVLYSKAHRQTIQGQFTQTKAAILGTTIGEQQKSALYLLDNNRSLSLVGKTRIEGVSYLPKAGVKRGYINGLSYYGDRLIYGEKKRSKRYLLPLNEERIKSLQQEFLKTNGTTSLAQEIKHSFGKQPLEIYAPTVYLKNQQISGQVIIRSDSLIYIGKDAKLEDVLLFAPNIVIEAGFEGQLQAFATKTILVQENVKLQYPSGLTLLSKYQKGNQILIENNAVIEGNVVVKTDRLQSNTVPVQLILNEKATIIGEIYSDTKVEFKGTLFGHMSCHSFIYRTAASIYDNHIYNAKMVYKNRPNMFLTSLYLADTEANKILKWVD